MGKLVLADNLLNQLSDRPPDGWISIQAVRAMIESEPEADLKEELKRRGFVISRKHVYIRISKCPICGKPPKKAYSPATNKPKYYCEDMETNWCRCDDAARKEWNWLCKERKEHEQIR